MNGYISSFVIDFIRCIFFLPYIILVTFLYCCTDLRLLWISQVKKYHLSLFELNDRVAFSEAKSVTCIISAKFFRLRFSAARERGSNWNSNLRTHCDDIPKKCLEMFRKGAKGLTFYTIFYFILIFQTIQVILFYISGKTLSNAKKWFSPSIDLF